MNDDLLLPYQLEFWCTGKFAVLEDSMWSSACHKCGQTGDEWDDTTDYWTLPMTDCRCCGGAGEH